jgi:hypothetical protein
LFAKNIDCGAPVKENLPWYDSWWLTKYLRAKAFVARHYPEQLNAFTEAFVPLKTAKDFQLQVHDRFFDDDQIQTIQRTIQFIKPDLLETHELSDMGRFAIHNHPMLDELHATVAPLVGECVGERVEPLYTFIALYNRNGQCPIHLDSPVTKWTVDFCMEQSRAWPISFSKVVPWPEEFDRSRGWEERIKSSEEYGFSSVTMEPGQTVIFSGSSQWHFREPFNGPGAGSHCNILCLHYVPAGMKEVSEWKSWEGSFRAPGLTEAIR